MGKGPDRELNESSRAVRDDNAPIEDGIIPPRRLKWIPKFAKFVNPPILNATVPVNAFPPS